MSEFEQEDEVTRFVSAKWDIGSLLKNWSLPADSCQRVWIEGVVVSCGGEFMLVDDGTGVIRVALGTLQVRTDVHEGMYMLVVGPPTSTDTGPCIDAHQIKHLADPNRESMWMLEVVHFHLNHKHLGSKGCLFTST